MSVEVRPTPATRGRTPDAGRRRRDHARRGGTGAVAGRSTRSGSSGCSAVIGVAIPVAVASHYGALGIPRSDDWSYLLTMFRWVEDGKLTFNGWVSMTLIGQVADRRPARRRRRPEHHARSSCSPR